ncbi:hypothetical protein TPHA_0D00400 [Tetrapisispora phaffii CBS 4417]|uniref:alanine--glyoxylate transaminase n=1 Tax=Tetrapisispora phaffii (strain ATCC 24235 / CBS 4417 / NBRC 1672 / NRRL Y-8282 / UCD 70-5) TaxID=1071381 RepID=G8BS62_TETPH|nr:hypothetical protein TPHA_0D00400 [Tetrapisispora phaffii CBS 4417]CCE62683.1 hypothetical protein TPHA_0D00400 [Tetrapisispora phaffii CBS 4417]
MLNSVKKIYNKLTYNELVAEKVILIPGPVELSAKVKESQTLAIMVPTDPRFVLTFQRVLRNTRKLFNSENQNAQPFVMSGSGTLGWDVVGANVIRKNDKVLMLNIGYFSSSFTKTLQLYGAEVKELAAQVGETVPLQTIKEELSKTDYKVLCITQVDTSTAVLSDVEGISKIAKEVSPDTLIIVDGVCSIGCETLKFDEWNIDFCLTASQKAIGATPGLLICMASERFLKESFSKRASGMFTSLENWYPIVKGYENGETKYFATLNIPLICTLDVALQEIFAYPGGLEGRIEATRKTSERLHSMLCNELGLKLVPKDTNSTAHGVSVVYHDDPQSIISYLNNNGVIITGGLHKDIKSKCFRVGHMGYSACDPTSGHMRQLTTLIRQTKNLPPQQHLK